jgi:glycosyltransferase involved in cell wall biosynthesis
MTGKLDSLYICPWRLEDALCQSQSLAYLRELADSGWRFGLITFETARGETASSFIHENITWYPVAWDSGTALSGKLLGILRVIATGSWICIRRRPTLIHSRTSLPVFAAVCLKLIFRRKFLYDADSMLSDEYADIGHLSTESYGFRFLRWSEGWARTNADAVIVLTDALRQIYRNDLKVKQPIDVIPCCVDSSKFQFNPEARREIRAQLGVEDEPLLVYVGKVGSWYLVEETFHFFKAFRTHSPEAKLLIVSTDPAGVFDDIAAKLGISRDVYLVRKSSYEKVPEWLSAADAGLALIKQVPSKRGSSPVKLAEYLACGLPVVITDHIGDCTSVINDYRVGVVLPNAEDSDVVASGAAELSSLVAEKDQLRSRCRSAAVKEFDVHGVGGARYRAIYGRFFDGEFHNRMGTSRSASDDKTAIEHEMRETHTGKGWEGLKKVDRQNENVQ